MKTKYLLSVIATVAITQATYAQYAQDALRFSTFQSGGTARIKGLGNAGTAIGGDLSSISNNPAGLGFFTHSELSITPEFNGSKVQSTYFGKTGQATNNQGNLNNASVVFYSRVNTPKGTDKSKGWLSVNFGAAYARTNNFYQNTYYNGVNPSTSISNYYAEQANTYGVDGGLGGWAYDQNLIDQYAAGTGSTYRSNAQAGVNQTKNTYSTGGQSEVDLSVGANYSNKFYLGFSLGITDLRYNTTSYFDESGNASILEGTPPVATNRAYQSTYAQDQVTRGTGFNMKLGFIYKPVDALRIGATITTPTWYNIDDSYGESLNTTYANNAGAGGINGTGGDPYTLTYNLRTPFKVAGGLAVFIKDIGFITGDVEYLHYSSIHLDYDGSQYDNNDIKRLYQSVVNAHVGAEIRADQLYFRGGYGIQGNPLKQYGGDVNTASGGLGYRFGSYYVDATYQHVSGKGTLFPYELSTGNNYGANVKNTYNNVFLTLGLKF